MKRILVVCGAGASSTFLVHRMRKVAAMRGLELTIMATSQSELAAAIADSDALLVGPHLAPEYTALAASAWAGGVPSALLPSTAFSAGGDDEALTLALALFDHPQTESLLS